MKNVKSVHEVDYIDPYKLLFPLGLVIALLSVSLWGMFSLRLINFYPKDAHSNLMFFGFFWSFISGFLMTAIPKMTKTNQANFMEIGICLFLILIQAVLNIRNMQAFSLMSFVFQIVALSVFGIRRLVKYGHIPFPGFIFIPVAFIQAIAAIYIISFTDFNNFQFLKLFWTEALVINLIFGLGSRLVPVITRVKNSISPDAERMKGNWVLSVAVLIIINLGYYFEVFFHKEIGIILRLAAIAIVSIFQFKIFSELSMEGYLGKMIRMSIGLIFIGQIYSLPMFGTDPSGVHVLYISGLALMTVLIAFRVMLAHGYSDINYEVSGARIPVVALLLVGAGFFRFLMKSDVTGDNLWFALFLFAAALLIWLNKFFKVSFSKFT